MNLLSFYIVCFRFCIGVCLLVFCQIHLFNYIYYILIVFLCKWYVTQSVQNTSECWKFVLYAVIRGVMYKRVGCNGLSVVLYSECVFVFTFLQVEEERNYQATSHLLKFIVCSITSSSARDNICQKKRSLSQLSVFLFTPYFIQIAFSHDFQYYCFYSCKPNGSNF